MQLFDLTLPLRPGPPEYPGDPEVSFVRTHSHTTDGYEVTQLCMGSHSGTHMDAPRHFFTDGATLDQFVIERLVGPGIVVDCRRSSGPASLAHIDAAVLTERLGPLSVPQGGFVLLWTEGDLLTESGARFLLDARPGVIGTDAPSLDEEPYPVHRLLLGAGILLAENLQGLDRLGPGLVTCAFLPLAAVGTDGAPVRAIAWR